jgi:hypothetical protein
MIDHLRLPRFVGAGGVCTDFGSAFGIGVPRVVVSLGGGGGGGGAGSGD